MKHIRLAVSIIVFFIIGYYIVSISSFSITTFDFAPKQLDTGQINKIISNPSPSPSPKSIIKKILKINPKPKKRIDKKSILIFKQTNRSLSMARDLDLLSRCISAEVGGQSWECKLAAGNVIINRITNDRFHNNTIEEVVYARGQFEVVSNGRINNKANTESVRAAKAILNGLRVLPDDVTYFFSSYIHGNWVNTRAVYKNIGDMVFSYVY